MSGFGRPSTYLNWTDGAPRKVIEPAAPFLLEGFDPGEAPPAQYFNWALYITDQWIQYLDALTNTGVPDQAIRLINGGFWSFNMTTQAFAWTEDANIAIPGTPDSANDLPAGSVTLQDGYIAYIDITLPILANGSALNGTNAITGMNFTGNLTVGMRVIGPGVPPSTTIIGVSSTGVTLSNNFTSDETNQTFYFSTTNSLTMLVAESDTFLPSFGTLIIARRVGEIVYVGVNATQFVLQDGESKEIGKTGFLQTYANVLAGENLSQGDAVYISIGGGGDGGRTAGKAYRLDCSAGNPQRSYFAGFVLSDVSSGAAVHLTFSGVITKSGLTPGAIYFGSDVSVGQIVTPRPTSTGASIMPVGIAISTTLLLLTNSEGLPGLPQNESLLQDDSLGVGDGSTTSFVTSVPPINKQSTLVFIDGNKVDPTAFSLAGSTITFSTAPAIGQVVEAQYVTANALSISMAQETPTTSDRITWNLSGIPLNKGATMVFIDGQKLEPSGFNLVLGVSSASIVLTGGALPLGQVLEAVYFANLASGGGGSVTGATNLGSGGVGIYSGLVAGVLQLLSIKAGSNISITTDGLGNIIVAATGAGGGYTKQVYGSPGTPASFAPASGLTPGAENEQTWILSTTPQGGGQLFVSASSQIANGTVVGQRLNLRGIDTVNYYTFVNLSNLNINGPCNLDSNQCLILEWDGTIWYEITRRN